MEISQHQVTWYLSGNYNTGQYCNGDYWVVGPVTITGINPKSTSGVYAAGRTIHGSMVNPAASTSAKHGFDSATTSNVAAVYSAALNFGRPNFMDMSEANPLVLQPNSSLLSSESVLLPNSRPQVSGISILTVVSSPPPSGSFRPPYQSGDKTHRWNVTGLNYNILPSLPPVSGSGTLSIIEDYLQKPWIEINTNVQGRYIHPEANQPDYGQAMCKRAAMCGLTLLLDYTQEQKQKTYINLVQYGLDVYGAARIGAQWIANGGHNPGRKLPCLLAGLTFNDPDILFLASGGSGLIFQEDQQSFYISQSDVTRTTSGVQKTYTAISGSGIGSLIVTVRTPAGNGITKGNTVLMSGISPNEYNGYKVVNTASSSSFSYINSSVPSSSGTGGGIMYFSTWAPDSRSTISPYLYSTIGIAEWGIQHQYEPQQDNYAWGTIYRDVNYSCQFSEYVAALLITGGSGYWNWPQFFDYHRRVWDLEKNTYGGTNDIQTFPRNLYLTYLSTSGDIATGQAAIPAFSPAGGFYAENQAVTMTCETPGASIRYTTDGSTPTSSSPIYSSPLLISGLTTLSAYAEAAGYTDSEIRQATYNINNGYVSDDFWQSVALGSLTSQNVRISYDATPSSGTINSVIGFGLYQASGYGDLAISQRFGTDGLIQAISGSSYASASIIPYTGNFSYHFDYEINVPANVYSLSCTPQDGVRVPVVTNAPFATVQSGTSSLQYISFVTLDPDTTLIQNLSVQNLVIKRLASRLKFRALADTLT